MIFILLIIFALICVVQAIFLIILYRSKSALEHQIKNTPNQAAYKPQQTAGKSPTAVYNADFKRIDYGLFLKTGIYTKGDDVFFICGGRKVPAKITEINASKQTEYKVIPKQQIPNLKSDTTNGLWVTGSALICVNGINGFILDNVPAKTLNRIDTLLPKISAYCPREKQLVTNNMEHQTSTRPIYSQRNHNTTNRLERS
eukprot:29333_1